MVIAALLILAGWLLLAVHPVFGIVLIVAGFWYLIAY